MKRDYHTGVYDNIVFFKGVEVEHTPAFGKKTLFVTGYQHIDEIKRNLNDIEHIFFGANHSFSPNSTTEWKSWTLMISYFLDQDFLCSLDIPISKIEDFHSTGLCEYKNFIPQIRVPIPFIKSWNSNTMIKLDDRDFNSTNPGIWTHSLNALMDQTKFTDWSDYKNDEVIYGN